MSDASKTPLARHVTAPVRVTYRDTDRMGHVYHANYFVWFEIGRTELLRSLGSVSYRDWEEQEGVYLPVVTCRAEFRRAALYDDLIEVVTHVVELTRATITFDYEVRRHNTNDLLATGSSRHAFVDSDGRITRAADRLLAPLFPRPPAPPGVEDQESTPRLHGSP